MLGCAFGLPLLTLLLFREQRRLRRRRFAGFAMSDDASLHLTDEVPFPRQFRSKIDWWLAALTQLPMVLVVAMVIAGVTTPVALLLILAPHALVTAMLARTFYVVDHRDLTAYCGPFRAVVPVHTIRTLTPTRSALSSPALSLDRIAVEHSAGRLLVSPRDKADFVRALVTVAPHIKVSGLPGAPDDESVAGRPSRLAGAVPALIVSVVTIVGLVVGGWLFYAGSRAPETHVSDGTMSIDGLYSTMIHRTDVIRISLEEQLRIGRRIHGFSGGRYVRGFFEVEGLGRSRLFVARDTPLLLVIRTKTEPLVIGFDDPLRTRALYAELQRSWGLPAAP